MNPERPSGAAGLRGETRDGQANDCTHASATGIDTTSPSDPAKVWACDHCGLRWRQDGQSLAATGRSCWQDETAADLLATARRIVQQTQTCGCPDEPHHNAMHDLAHDAVRVLAEPPSEVEGMANDCTHASATGIDTTPCFDPAKVWACDHCGLRWRQDGQTAERPSGTQDSRKIRAEDGWPPCTVWAALGCLCRSAMVGSGSSTCIRKRERDQERSER